MQTFLPYSDFKKVAECLDNKRLGKQRVEAMQILNTIQGRSEGWKNHPAVKMWIGFDRALTSYMNSMILEWLHRGFNNTMVIGAVGSGRVAYPPWLGKEELHSSHRSNLLRKDPNHYRQFGWEEAPDMPYYWPTKETSDG